MIEVKNLTKRFDGFTALNGLTMTVPTGSVYGLVGPNGAGKSTIIRHITGVYRPDSGEVLIGGEPVFENPPVKARIACIPDDLSCHAGTTIRELKTFYKGLYPAFSDERFTASQIFLSSTNVSRCAAFPRVCRNRRRSGSPSARSRTISCSTSRSTDSTP